MAENKKSRPFGSAQDRQGDSVPQDAPPCPVSEKIASSSILWNEPNIGVGALRGAQQRSAVIRGAHVKRTCKNEPTEWRNSGWDRVFDHAKQESDWQAAGRMLGYGAVGWFVERDRMTVAWFASAHASHRHPPSLAGCRPLSMMTRKD
jgi:hypothetical protein